MLLHRRIEGVPNFRRVPMVLRPVHSGDSSSDEESDFVVEENGKMICGWSVASRNVFRICISLNSRVLVECQRSKGIYCLSFLIVIYENLQVETCT